MVLYIMFAYHFTTLSYSEIRKYEQFTTRELRDHYLSFLNFLVRTFFKI